MSRLRYARPTPAETTGYGEFSLGLKTGIIAAGLAANAELFQFRNSHASALAVIQKLKVSAAVSTTYFAAGVPLVLDVVKATAWTVAGSGGTGVTPAALLKKRSSFSSTLMAAGDVRVATTAGLTAGTKTLEGNSLGMIASGAPITASLSGQIFAPGTDLLDLDLGSGEYPLVLAANEGFVIRAVQTPATGTWEAAFKVEWLEALVYPY